MGSGQVALRAHHFELPLRHAFGISRSTHTVQTSVIVELDDGVHQGYGEATTNPYYGVSLESLIGGIEKVREFIQSFSWDHPAQLWEALNGVLENESFIQCAVDQAAHDLWGKQNNLPTYRMLGVELDSFPDSSFTIGLDDLHVMVDKLKEEPGWPIYKIKLGTDHDLQIVEELRKHSDALFRVDANCGWTAKQAIEYSAVLKDLGVEFIEQPLPAEDWTGAKKLFVDTALPIIADESCLVVSDVKRCVNYFHGVNIKLVKCGGMTPALRMIREAQQLGMKVMIGCMTESSVGISAIAQLLPLLDYVDMDGANLLAEDAAAGVTVLKGRCHFPDITGNGIASIDRDRSNAL